MSVKTEAIQNQSSPTVNLSLDASGNVAAGANLTVAGSATIPTMAGNPTFSGTPVFSNVPSLPSSMMFRNRIINGNMYIAQRGTSATVTAGTAVPTISTGYPCLDRWFVYSTGANVTAAQVAGSGSNKNLLQITGAASVTAVGVGQRIEQLNSYDLAGQTCTLSVNIANSVLTTVTWTASYATTADTFGTIGTPTKTQIATGTFTVSSTLTQYTANITIPAAATTGIEILFTVGAQTSGTWQIGNVQLEVGTVATPFERRLYGQELALCQRYYYKTYNVDVVPGTVTNVGSVGSVSTSGGVSYTTAVHKTTMRITPTITLYNGATGGTGTWRDGGAVDVSVTVSIQGANGFVAFTTAATASTTIFGQYTASAEL